ncbi:MAG: hypothetical protein ACAI44_31150 [Candidatus Sericytochromatia bacterium]
MSDFTVLQQLLEAEGYVCTPLAASWLHPVAHLVIGPFSLALDPAADQPLSFSLDLLFSNDMLLAAGLNAPASETLLLACVLPLPVPADRLADVCCLLSFCNRLLPLGTLFLNQQEALSFRYTFKAESREAIEPQLVLAALKLSLGVLTAWAPLVHDLAAGATTLAQAAASLHKTFADA